MPTNNPTKPNKVTRAPKPYSSKSFVHKISDAFERPDWSSFQAFPQATKFSGQDREEEIVLIVRKHPIVYFTRFLFVLGLVLLYLLFMAFLSAVNIPGIQFSLVFGSTGIFVLLVVMTISFDTFIKWFYNVNIITNQRVIDVDMHSIMSHDRAETQLEQIEDVHHSASGFWSTVFDYGDIYLQTAGAAREFEMIGVPRPRDIQDTIFDLLELKQKNEI